jgi:RNA polymerase sigma factor (sigma-70 family)
LSPLARFTLPVKTREVDLKPATIPQLILTRISSDEEVSVSPNSSQSPDTLNIKQLIAKVSKAVCCACRFYGYQANRDEVDDFSQDILVTLFNDDGRVLKSFANRSSIETWLYTIVRRTLAPHLLRRRWEKENLNDVDDLSPEALRCDANQEERLIDKDERKILYAIISRLPNRKRQLMELDLQELKSREIAKEMGIKVESVYRQKSALLKEIQRLIEEGLL